MALPGVELVLANIAAEAVAELGPRLRARRAITSGYLVSEQPTLAGFRIVERRERGGWAADVWTFDLATHEARPYAGNGGKPIRSSST